MNESYSEHETPEPGVHSRKEVLLLRTLPFLGVLALTVFGVAYTSVAQQPLGFFWEFVAISTGILCVTTGWTKVDTRQARVRLIWTQAVHWAAIFVAMNILFLPSVQRLLPSPAASLALLLLLALGTFLAGIHVSWQICVLGLVMALLVPAIAWLKGSALFLVLAIAAGVGLGSMFWRRRGEA
jgi:hypothetical protein